MGKIGGYGFLELKFLHFTQLTSQEEKMLLEGYWEKYFIRNGQGKQANNFPETFDAGRQG